MGQPCCREAAVLGVGSPASRTATEVDRRQRQRLAVAQCCCHCIAMQGDKTMMSYDILLIAAAALSTVVILFGVVIFSGYQSQHEHANASLPRRRD
jgi:hypothetical protein